MKNQIENFLIFNPKTSTWREGPKIPGRQNFVFSVGVFSRNEKSIWSVESKMGIGMAMVAWFDESIQKQNTVESIARCSKTSENPFGVALVGDRAYVAGGRTSLCSYW